MSVKRSKITADKARERITVLEESIQVREQKLELLRVRLSRHPEPEEKLLQAEERLNKRLGLEREQLQKLKRLLARHGRSVNHESAEYYGNEEIDELHRSFEEVRQDLSLVKRRLETSDLTRDIPGRLTSFEERLSRREEADSGVFAQILTLQSAFDQERETLRKMSRRIREQEQSLEALREAVEDSVVATVDLAERLDELEESLNDNNLSGEHLPTLPERANSSSAKLGPEDLASLRSEFEIRIGELQTSFQKSLEHWSSQAESSESVRAEFETLLDAVNELDARLEMLETRHETEESDELGPEEDSESVLFVGSVEALERRAATPQPASTRPQPESSPKETSAPEAVFESKSVPFSSPAQEPTTQPVTIATFPVTIAPTPAVFASHHESARLVVATFSNSPRRRVL